MRIFVQAKPGSKVEKVEVLRPVQGSQGGQAQDGLYVVSVKEKPVMGQANEAICRALAEYFGVPKYCVNIVAGEWGRRKIVEIDDGVKK